MNRVETIWISACLLLIAFGALLTLAFALPVLFYLVDHGVLPVLWAWWHYWTAS